MKKGYIPQFIESNNPFEEILNPVTRRKGFGEGAQPILPTYFYRLIGITGLDTLSQDQYYNDIYKLNQKLSQHKEGYIKLEGPIQMPNNDEIQHVVSYVSQGIPALNRTLKESIVSQVKNSKVLQMFSAPFYNEIVDSAFNQVMELYMRHERNINESKAENFALKLIVWLKRYQKHLFKESQPNDNSKVLFYGAIKNHEVYFITLLALMGCDVVFIHSEKGQDKFFDEINRTFPLSKQIVYPDSLPMESFPKTERYIQKTTVAYNASKEIQETLYGADVGLFKAWQYQSGNTKSVMLRTTYDELKILWDEEARIRPEFEVRGDTVYVPNIFAKVNGTQENLQEYWNDIYKLTRANHVVIYKQIPFSTIKYTKQEMYSTAFLFTREGLLDEQALYKSPVYTLQYLKPSIQHFIIQKINELILSKLFRKDIDETMRLKILMTIITMDAELLRLLEVFDYTGKIPKIIVYSGKREQLSEEDAILLSFFQLVSADIVIYTPTNYANIENWIKPEYFSVHQLPSVQFDMEFQANPIKAKIGWFKRIFPFLFN